MTDRHGHLWPSGKGGSARAELASVSSAGIRPALVSSHLQRRSATESGSCLQAPRPEILSLPLGIQRRGRQVEDYC